MIVVSVLVAVAILGYLVGHRHSPSTHPERTLSASVANVVLNYPASWSSAAAAPSIPGLTLNHAIALAPRGDASHAGLIAGQLPGSEASALPRSFVSQLRGLPETSIVELLGNQAYRYARLAVPGFDHELTLYTVPNPGGEAAALACYSSTGFAAQMRTCEHVIATLTLIGQAQSYELTPSPDYARALNASIQTLDQQRLALRSEIAVPVAGATLQRASARLSSAFAHAADAVSALEPSLSAARAQSELEAALLKARDAYAALAAAASAGEAEALTASRTQVYEAEAAVDEALAQFTLLGYKAA